MLIIIMLEKKQIIGRLKRQPSLAPTALVGGASGKKETLTEKNVLMETAMGTAQQMLARRCSLARTRVANNSFHGNDLHGLGVQARRANVGVAGWSPLGSEVR